MAISLKKGANVSLSKEAPSVTKFHVGLGWDARTTDGAPFDLDVMAVSVGANGKTRDDNDFFYYGLASPKGAPFDSADGSLHHNGDNLTGAGDGDDEQLVIDTTKVPADIEKIVVLLAIYDADTRKQSFGDVRNAYLRVADEANQSTDIVKLDLSEDFSTEQVLNVAEFYKKDGEWKVKHVGQGYGNGLVAALADFGLNAS